MESRDGDFINLAISARWNVPELTSIGEGLETMGIWIDGNSSNSPGLLQAGIAGSVQAGGAPTFFAWFEWLSTADPVPAQIISNFPVQVGEIVETQIWITSPTTAMIVMQNLSSESRETPVIVPLISPGIPVVGNSVEWIVERPLTDGVLSTLPFYSPVTFTNAVAWSQSTNISLVSFKSFALRSGFAMPVSARIIAESLSFTPPISLREMMSETGIVFAESGETITMDENGAPVSVAHIQGKDTLTCEHLGLQPGGPPVHLQG